MADGDDTNEVAEWLGSLVKGEEDPTAASYPDPPDLNRTTAEAWFARLENSRWKGDKRAKNQQDFDMMDELWTKITGMKINKRGDGPALRDEICNVCSSTLDSKQTEKAVTAAEFCKLRQQTRENLRPHLQNHLLSYDELTPWIDNFLRVYMPRAVFHWKNQLRQLRSKTQGTEDDPHGKKKTASGAGATSPKSKRKTADSNEQKGPAKKTCSQIIERQIQHTQPREHLPFVRREIEISHERTSEYIIGATAALIEPIHLPTAVVSASHLSFALLQQMLILEGGDFADVGKTFEIWDPAENTSIESDFQLRNAIGLQWVKMIYAGDQSMFKLVVRSRDRE
jgi:hypothetical protein